MGAVIGPRQSPGSIWGGVDRSVLTSFTFYLKCQLCKGLGLVISTVYCVKVQQQASVKKKIKCTQETVRDQWSILLL